jgi:hypothetical protein
MSTDRTRNGTQPAVVSSDPRATRQDPRLTARGRQPAADPTTSDPAGIPSTGDSLTAERTERRRQRTATRQARTASKPSAARRRDPTTESTSGLTPPRPLTLRDSVSATSIAVLAAGGVLGAILGALGAPGWVIGLLAAALTVILSAVLRRYSRSA